MTQDLANEIATPSPAEVVRRAGRQVGGARNDSIIEKKLA